MSDCKVSLNEILEKSKHGLDQFPLLHTNRVTLRELKESDESAMLGNMADRDVTRYLSSYGPSSEKEMIEQIKKWKNQFEEKNSVRWGIVLDGEDTIIGSIYAEALYAWLTSNPLPPIEIGYDLKKEFWNSGLMTEIVAAVVEFWVIEMNVVRIQARVNPENIGSHRVLFKNGFKKEGLLKQYEYHTGRKEYNDCFMFAFINESVVKTW